MGPGREPVDPRLPRWAHRLGRVLRPTGCRRMRRGCCAWSGGTRSSSSRRGPRQSRNSSPGARGRGYRGSSRQAAGVGSSAPEKQRPPGTSGDVAPGPRPPRLVRPTPTTLSGGWLRCPPGAPLSGPSTRTRPATATTTRCSAASARRGHPGVRAADPGSRVAGRPDGPLRARDLQPPGLPGPGWCTALAPKERRTQSPSAGGA